MNAAKAAIAENGDTVPGFYKADSAGDDVIDICFHKYFTPHGADGLKQVVYIEPFLFRDLVHVRHRCQDHHLAGTQRQGQFILENLAAGTVGAGLEDGQQAPARAEITALQRGSGFLDRSGMMAEIIYHFDPIHLPSQVLAAGCFSMRRFFSWLYSAAY